MKLVSGLKIEILKLKNTSYWLFQIGSTLVLLFLLGGYFRMYHMQAEERRIRLVYEIIATLLPVICSIAIAYHVKQEEQIANLYGMLSVTRRESQIGVKLLIAWTMGNISLLVITIGIGVLSSRQPMIIYELLGLYIGMAVFSLFFYTFHFFLNLRYGIGMSLFWGVFESMQAVMYSNIKIYGMFRYIPFAWLMEWKEDLLEGVLAENRSFWSICMLLLAIGLAAFVWWFAHWEGRRNHAV